MINDRIAGTGMPVLFIYNKIMFVKNPEASGQPFLEILKEMNLRNRFTRILSK